MDTFLDLDADPGGNPLSEYLRIREYGNQLITRHYESQAYAAVVSPPYVSGADVDDDDSCVTGSSAVGAASAADACGAAANASGVVASATCPTVEATCGASFTANSHTYASPTYISGAEVVDDDDDDDMCEVEHPDDRDQQFFGEPGKRKFWVNGKPRTCERCGDVEGTDAETKHRACPICLQSFKDAKKFSLVHKIR